MRMLSERAPRGWLPMAGKTRQLSTVGALETQCGSGGRSMREFVTIGVGALLGANVRYWVANYFAARLGLDFPYGTLFINITGSFLLGFVLTLLGNRLVVDPGFRLLLGTGFLG